MGDRGDNHSPVLLTVSERLDERRAADARLLLPFELRCRSRLRARLTSGEEIGIVLPRGQILRAGDLLRAPDGRVIEIAAATESVSTVHGSDRSELARAAYHLGNRHVALQIGDGWLRYLHDHVLDDMVRGLGLQVRSEQAAFEPEGGAYSNAASSTAAQHHGHDLEHGLMHTHDQPRPLHSHE